MKKNLRKNKSMIKSRCYFLCVTAIAVLLAFPGCNSQESCETPNTLVRPQNILDEGLGHTQETLTRSNQTLFQELKSSKDTANSAETINKAEKVMKMATELVDLIQEIKIQILENAGEEEAYDTASMEIDATKIKGRDKVDPPSFVMVGEDNNKEGRKLRLRMEEYRKFLTGSIIDPKISPERYESILTMLNTEVVHFGENGASEMSSWESQHFEHLPLSGVLVILSGLQINIRQEA